MQLCNIHDPHSVPGCLSDNFRHICRRNAKSIHRYCDAGPHLLRQGEMRDHCTLEHWLTAHQHPFTELAQPHCDHGHQQGIMENRNRGFYMTGKTLKSQHTGPTDIFFQWKKLHIKIHSVFFGKVTHQFIILCGEFYKPLIILQNSDDSHQIPGTSKKQKIKQYLQITFNRLMAIWPIQIPNDLHYTVFFGLWIFVIFLEWVLLHVKIWKCEILFPPLVHWGVKAAPVAVRVAHCTPTCFPDG